MTRYAARDEQGRPIVAELGRAETPAETAERKAAASEKRRSNQTTFNFVIAVVASLLIVGIIVMFVVRPDQGVEGRVADPIDYALIAEQAQGAVDTALIVPVLPPGWEANRAELRTGDVTVWEIGFVTPAGDYAELTQALDANPTWLDDRLESTPVADEVDIDGITWTRHDRRDASDLGNLAEALVAEGTGSTLVVSGTASSEELQLLAAAAGTEWNG